jgi:hypothetical protein
MPCIVPRDARDIKVAVTLQKKRLPLAGQPGSDSLWACTRRPEQLQNQNKPFREVRNVTKLQ